ncbi:MAG: hypothetical protein LBL07_04135 [Tannerella sp.]|jgi:hypothetical protein|nr:hypothetical protein [Tannerella sp.]
MLISVPAPAFESIISRLLQAATRVRMFDSPMPRGGVFGVEAAAVVLYGQCEAVGFLYDLYRDVRRPGMFEEVSEKSDAVYELLK